MCGLVELLELSLLWVFLYVPDLFFFNLLLSVASFCSVLLVVVVDIPPCFYPNPSFSDSDVPTIVVKQSEGLFVTFI